MKAFRVVALIDYVNGKGCLLVVYRKLGQARHPRLSRKLIKDRLLSFVKAFDKQIKEKRKPLPISKEVRF